MYLLHLLTSITSFSKILISTYLLAHFVSFAKFLPILSCFVGDIVIDQYQCNSRLTESFTLILVGYKAALTGVGAIIAFRVRSLGKKGRKETNEIKRNEMKWKEEK